MYLGVLCWGWPGRSFAGDGDQAGKHEEELGWRGSIGDSWQIGNGGWEWHMAYSRGDCT